MTSVLASMGRFYNVPKCGTLGATNLTISDAQAGFEKAIHH